MGRLKKYVLEAPSLAPRERFGLFQQVEQMVFLPEKNQPDIHLDSFMLIPSKSRALRFIFLSALFFAPFKVLHDCFVWPGGV